MQGVGMTGIDWLDTMMGANTAQDAGTAVTGATQATNVLQSSQTTPNNTAGSWTDFIFQNGGRALDYAIAKDRARTTAGIQAQQAQMANAPVFQAGGLSMGPMAVLLGMGVLALLVLRK